MAALAACSRAPEHGAERLAIFPFENLTGDPALDWVASAAATVVAAEIGPGANVTAFREDTLDAAYAGRATRFVQGYFTGRAGELRFEIDTEDASRHKIIAHATEHGSVLAAMNAAAKQLDPAAHGFSTSNEQALDAWGRGDFEQAVSFDPDFGAAWLSWMQSLAEHGQRAEAADAAHRALAQPGLRSAVDRAEIEAASATLAGDVAGRARALQKLAGLRPDDAAVLDTLAQAQLRARDFAGEAATLRKRLAVGPRDAATLNSLGYAEAQSGDLAAAQKTFDDYGKMPGQKINALDSLGEAYFMNGRFADAERLFLEAAQQDPRFLNGEDLSKAAYAHWLGGDLPGADAMFKRYLDLHPNDPLRPWHEAAWLYSTGRRDQAIARLAQFADKAVAARQLALWNAKLADDPAQLKTKFENSTPPTDSAVRIFYAAALVASGQLEQARPLLRLWPLPGEPGDRMLESLVFPKYIELRKAVGLSSR